MAFAGALELLRIWHQGLVSNLWGLAILLYKPFGWLFRGVFTYWALAGGLPVSDQLLEPELPRRNSRLS